MLKRTRKFKLANNFQLIFRNNKIETIYALIKQNNKRITQICFKRFDNDIIFFEQNKNLHQMT